MAQTAKEQSSTKFLEFDALQRIQQEVLGTETLPVFRTRDAFAKEGRERYPLGTDTEVRFRKCLKQGTSDIFFEVSENALDGRGANGRWFLAAANRNSCSMRNRSGR